MKSGRDHNRHAFSTIMAGGGFRAGHIHGATDEFGYKSVEDRVSVPDACHDPESAADRSHEADLPLQRPSEASDRS